MLSALRIATADRHAELDSGLPLAGAAPTLADYQAHLRMVRAWLAPLEEWLGQFDDGPQDGTLPMLRRVPLIDADLADPAMPDGPEGVCAGAPWCGSAGAAYRWGVCYVIEGSQLGGAVLHQRLAGTLAPHPLGYLRAEAEGPGPRWRAFMQALRAGVRSEAEIADACRGACDAFDRILALRPLAEKSLPGLGKG